MQSIGLMSGTSMDGIDAALIKTDGITEIKPLAYIHLPYDKKIQQYFKSAELAMHEAQGNLAQAKAHYQQTLLRYKKNELGLEGEISNDLSFEDIIALSTQLHENAVRLLLEKAGKKSAEIDVIGYHGQTLFHRPQIKCTYQMGDPSYLSYKLEIPVIYDIRQKDVQAGGQGAPFAPIYHQALAIRDQKIPLAVVNCGGIANVSFILGNTINDLLGFDTGPGNGLIDAFIRKKTRGRENMDFNGRYGLHGQIHEAMIQELIHESHYLSKPPPRSLDIRDLKFLDTLNNLPMNDIIATLEAFTAETIVQSLKWIEAPYPRTWVLAGGGWHNPVIKRELIKRLQKAIGSHVDIFTADEIHWHNDAMEAQMMAYLAVRSLKQLPISTPKTTGVSEPLSGGVLFDEK